jgi:hypothetical protein
LANTSSAQESLRRCTMHVIIFYILFSLSSFSFVFYNVIYIEKSITLYIVHWHQHARGGSPGGAIHDLYGESTNKTGGRVWIALYVKKQLKVIFNIPRFTIAYENMTGFFSSSFDRFSRPLQLIHVLSYLHGTTNLHVFPPKSQLKRIIFTVITNVNCSIKSFPVISNLDLSVKLYLVNLIAVVIIGNYSD